MIPLLIAPVLNRWDVLQRMLDSLDHPVKHLLIVNNGMTGTPPLVYPETVSKVTAFTPPLSPLGYGGAINFGITQTPQHPWWMWTSNDVVFEPGHLATVVERMEAADGPRIVTGGFTWAAVNRELIDLVGLIDEWSFFPIYYDDNDFHRRCQVAEVDWVEDWNRGSRHGDGIHSASVAIMSDPQARVSNDRSFAVNGSAYLEKWGGPPGHEKYETPWNSGMPVWVTRPSIAGRLRRRW